MSFKLMLLAIILFYSLNVILADFVLHIRTCVHLCDIYLSLNSATSSDFLETLSLTDMWSVCKEILLLSISLKLGLPHR